MNQKNSLKIWKLMKVRKDKIAKSNRIIGK